MNHWIILPILLPAIVAPLLALSVRHDIVLARAFSIGSTVLLVLLSILHLYMTSDGVTQVYPLGNWPPPFGIVLVMDRLSATMLFLTSTLGLCVQIYAMNGWDLRGEHFYPLFQFQLLGICGAFLTGDLFNLFVFFEVLLIASYGLMAHSGGRARMLAAIQYVVVNLVGSTIFLFALGLIYSVTGTLNMADLALIVPHVPAEDQALLNTGAALLLTVFCIKAALFPVHFWLPGTYANAPGPVAALFSIMTKVGVYSILRVFPLIFVGQMAMDQIETYLLPCALITVVLGAIGVISARSLGQQTSFMTLASVATLFIAVAGATIESHSAALYYLLHSTIGIAALFLIVDMVGARRPGIGDALTNGPAFAHGAAIAVMFFLAAVAITGMPPLSGFLGKLLVLESMKDTNSWIWIWSIVLSASLFCIVGFSRSGSLLFWKCLGQSDGEEETICDESAKLKENLTPTVLSTVSIGALLAMLIALTGFAGPIANHLQRTSEQIHNRTQYMNAVLGEEAVRRRESSPMHDLDSRPKVEDHHSKDHGGDH